MLMAPTPSFRMMVGPAVYCGFSVYSLVASFGMLACAIVIDYDHSPEDRRIKLPAQVVSTLMAVFFLIDFLGYVLLLRNMVPKYRSTLYKHDTLKAYIARSWETRTTARAGWGSSLDAARGMLYLLFLER